MTSKVSQARAFAPDAHRNQLYGDKPYIEHLDAVWRIAVSYGLPEHVRVACYLHDVLEDTQTIRLELEVDFGKQVAELVQCVTDRIFNADGTRCKNRAERKAATYPQIEADPDAILVKLCDRIANVRESKNNNPGLFKMYQKEHNDFSGHFFNGVMTPIWEAYFKLFEQ